MTMLNTGELVAYLKLDMAQFDASLVRAKEKARTAGADIALHLRVEPNLDTVAYHTGLARIVEETKVATTRMKEMLGTVRGGLLVLNVGGVDKANLQLKSVIGNAERLRTLITDPLVLGGAEDARLKAELAKMQEQVDKLRATAARPIIIRTAVEPVGGAAGGAAGRASSGSGALAGFGGGLLRNAGYMVGAAAIFGVGAALYSTIKATASFETEINTLGAVTGASGTKLQEVSKKALQLGADFTIANASAADAAVTMTQLVKGGLSVDEAMKAARGSLQLAAAGNITFVQAADLTSAAIAQFALKGKDASHVADVLANAAHSARGTVLELGTGLTYAGTLSHQAGYSLEATASVLAEFAKFGLVGSLGGTTLKDFIMRVEKAAVSTGAAGKAYKELGLNVYDANGNLKSAGVISDQLAAAHKRLAPQIYNSAMQTLLGARAITGGNILMSQGSKGLDVFTEKIKNLGGAQAFSAARMKGLGGAFANLKNQVETAQIVLGEKFSPGLQKVVTQIAGAVPVVTSFLTGSQFSGGLKAIGHWFEPLISGASDLISKALPMVLNFAASVGRGFGTIADFIKPVVHGIGEFFRQIAAGSGSSGVQSLLNVVSTIGSVFGAILTFFKPVSSALGWLIGVIGKLPGPIWAGITALGAFLLLKGPLTAMFVKLGLSLFDFTVALQATFAGGMLSGIRNLGRSLMAALGGPWGLAIAAAGAALAWLFTRTNGAAKAQTDFSAAIDTTTGKLNDQANLTVATKVADAEKAYIGLGGAVGDYTAAVSGSIPAQQRITGLFSTLESNAVSGSDAWKKYATVFAAFGITASDVAAASMAGGDAMDHLKGKIASSTDVVKRGNLTLNDLNNIFSSLGGTTKDLSDKYQTYQGFVISLSGTQLSDTDIAKNAAAAHKILATAVTTASTATAGSVQTLTNAQLGAKEYAAAMRGAALDTGTFYSVVKGAKAGDPSTIITPMGDAFAAYTAAVKEATATTDLFVFAMDKLSGRNIPVEDAMRANAAAARGIAADGRKAAAAQQAVLDAQAKLATDQGGTGGGQAAQDKAAISANTLATAQAHLQKLQSSGKTTATQLAAAQAQVDLAQQRANKTANAAQGTAADPKVIAADQRAVADALAAVADQKDAAAKQEADYQATVATRIAQVAHAADVTGGYNAALKAGTAEMAKQRQAFIAAKVAGGMSAAAAAKSADFNGLIATPKAVTVILNADPHLAMEAFKVAQKAANDLVAHEWWLKLKGDTTDAVTKFKAWFGQVAAMPADVRTKFEADIKDAELHGVHLYQVYNATTGNWTAQFLTPNAAQSKATAGQLVQQYDLAKGTWTADLVATDNASAKVTALDQLLQGIKDKTVTLTVLQQTADASIAANNAAKASASAAHPGNIGGNAEGGTIHGGIPGRDSVLRYLMPGEEVIRTRQAEKYRPLLKAINNGHGQFGMAGGGTVGGLHLDMGGAGDAGSPSLAAVAAFMATHTAAIAAQSAAATAAAVAAAAPTASSAGVEQWRPLATQMFTAKGVPLQYVQTLLNQMNQESSGNPAAINLTDSNAQAGHPSKGLLQFIDSTFNSFADPGFNTNIYDPASQFRAFVNYINARYGGMAAFTAQQSANGWGAYADGGTVPLHMGTPGKDSVNALVMPGEEIISTGPATKHRALLKAINADHFAKGGTVPHLYHPPHVPNPQHAPHVPGQHNPHIPVTHTRVPHAPSPTTGAAGTAEVFGVSESALSGDAAQSYTPRLANVIQAMMSISNGLSGVRDQVITDRGNVATAQQNLATAEQNRAAATTKAQKASADAQIRAAQKQLDKANLIATAAERNYTAAMGAQKSLQGSYHNLQSLSARWDTMSARIAANQATLAQMRSDKASAVAGYATSIAGYDGGVTGHSDVRTTSAAVVNGMRFDLRKVTTFKNDLATLRQRGLSTQLLNQLESAFGSGGEVTAHALALGSQSDLRSVNSYQAQLNSVANTAAHIGPDAQYDTMIKQESAAIYRESVERNKLNAMLEHNATMIRREITSAISSWTINLDGKLVLAGIHPHIQAAVTKAKGQG